MASTYLKTALLSIDTQSLINEFLADPVATQIVADGAETIAIWANSLTTVENTNPANAFLAEMQRSCHDVAALLALALYIPAAASMRTMVETCLYYSFFRSHPSELATLASDPDYYISKTEIIDYHKLHSTLFKRCAHQLGIPHKLKKWYSSVSAIVHGQLPGTWGTRLDLAQTKHSASVRTEAIKTLSDGVAIIHFLLLTTAGGELWSRFHPASKKSLLKGIPAEKRALLGLDGA